MDQTNENAFWIEDDDGDYRCSNCKVCADIDFDNYSYRGGKIEQNLNRFCGYCGKKMENAR